MYMGKMLIYDIERWSKLLWAEDIICMAFIFKSTLLFSSSTKDAFYASPNDALVLRFFFEVHIFEKFKFECFRVWGLHRIFSLPSQLHSTWGTKIFLNSTKRCLVDHLKPPIYISLPVPVNLKTVLIYFIIILIFVDTLPKYQIRA